MTEVRLAAVGDISLQGGGRSNLFELVSNKIKNADISFANLETVLIKSNNSQTKAVRLCTEASDAEKLKKAGFDIVSLSNNHTGDLGKSGLSSTKQALESNGIEYVSGDDSENVPGTILEIKNRKVGFLAYPDPLYEISILDLLEDFSINKLDEKKIISDIELIQGYCDVVVVSLHWGIEHVSYPSPNQIELAHKLVDNGANIILGHHPHVLQGIEEYNGGIIAYSLGNFQFRSSLSPHGSDHQNESIILVVDIDENKNIRYDFHPIMINDSRVPEIPEQTTAEKIRKNLEIYNKNIEKIDNNFWYKEISSRYLISNFDSYKSRIAANPTLPLLEMLVWSFTPFCIKCYKGLLRKHLYEEK